MGGICIVVFDGITGQDDFNLLQSFNGSQKIQLNLGRQTGGQSIRVNHQVVFGKPGRFQKNLVAFFVGKFDDLVFDGRTITWTNAGDLPPIKCGTPQIVLNYLVGSGIGKCNMAGHLRQKDFRVPEGKFFRRIVAGLDLERVPVDGPLIETGWGPGFHPSHP